MNRSDKIELTDEQVEIMNNMISNITPELIEAFEILNGAYPDDMCWDSSVLINEFNNNPNNKLCNTCK